MGRWCCLVLFCLVIVGGSGTAGAVRASVDDLEVAPILAALDVPADSPAAFPASHLETLDGVVLSPDQMESPAIINFWASWCKPCRHELNDLEALANIDSFSAVQMLTINVGEDTETIQKFLDEHELDLPVVGGAVGKDLYERIFDGTFVQLPATVFLDRRGRVVARKNGAIDFGSESFRRVLRDL